MSRHHVTVEDGVLTKFVCEDDQGPCHTYPGCDCEEWASTHAEDRGPGHEMVYHEACWMQWWFDNPETTMYGETYQDFDDGGPPPGMTQSGYVNTWYDECVVWSFEVES